MVDQEWAKPESLFDLLLESFRIGERTKYLLNHLIIVALDDHALQYCLRVHPHCYHLRDSKRMYEPLNRDGLVESWSKKSLVKEILELGYNMMFTEADVMWLRNPLMHCHSQNSISVACGFSSSYDQQQHVIKKDTRGFFYAKSNDITITINLFKVLSVERVVYPETKNQSLYDIVMRKDVINVIGKEVTYLDDVNFGSFCQQNPHNESQINTIHASCCKNTESKVHHLKLLIQDLLSMKPRWIIPRQCMEFPSL